MSIENSKIRPYNFNVLLVDDDEELVLVNEDVLKQKDYNIFKAFSGLEAIETVKNESIDILIIDHYMKGMNGEEAIKKIREFNSEIVIILQTGFAGDISALNMLENLNIQGYHDKAEGIDKLLVWVMSAARMCAQIKETTKMVKEVNIAQETLKSMRENQAWLIEQARLSSLGQKMGSVFHDMINPLISIEDSVKIIEHEIKQVDDSNITKDQLSEIKKKIMERCNSADKRIRFIKDMRNAVVAQSRQEKVNKWEYFSVKSLMERVRICVQYRLSNECKCEIINVFSS